MRQLSNPWLNSRLYGGFNKKSESGFTDGNRRTYNTGK